MALLSKAQILGADDIPYETVHVSEWKGEIRLRGLTGKERDKYEQSCSRIKNGVQQTVVDNAIARLVAWCAVGPDGSRLFIGEDEVKELGNSSSIALQKVFKVAARLSGLTDQVYEDMTEGFDAAPSESFTSD